ncbi:MAG TPA: hypothetical protein PKN95_15305 [Verrucomicrobiota bacterium]|nr:hypothetical protein [Verrucomicrobiota bacterium]HNT15627.1 hypothetical protein [Verrucomicrobiota bacterium]
MKNWWRQVNRWWRPARLSGWRIALALLVAVTADGLQIPLQAPPFPEIIDVVAMLLTSLLIGFHLLLLPTFAIEFVPVVGLLPTWTGCVVAVIGLRRKEADPPGTTPARPPPRIN